jgi:hypothetical protein
MDEISSTPRTRATKDKKEQDHVHDSLESVQAIM